MIVNCFLPCRKGSERVKEKNTKPFSSYQNGLIEIKLEQLSKVPEINNIILSTDDEKIIEYAKTTGIKNLIIHQRDPKLASSLTSTDELVLHAKELCGEGHILWTHVTSPFLNSKIYSDIISKYAQGLERGYDSLMTTTEIKGFVWNDDGPINYNREIEKWPRTQTINALHEINSGVFLTSTKIYSLKKDRIGEKPFLYSLSKMQGFDIDWPEDFEIAEAISNASIVHPN